MNKNSLEKSTNVNLSQKSSLFIRSLCTVIILSSSCTPIYAEPIQDPELLGDFGPGWAIGIIPKDVIRFFYSSRVDNFTLPLIEQNWAGAGFHYYGTAFSLSSRNRQGDYAYKIRPDEAIEIFFRIVLENPPDISKNLTDSGFFHSLECNSDLIITDCDYTYDFYRTRLDQEYAILIRFEPTFRDRAFNSLYSFNINFNAADEADIFTSIAAARKFNVNELTQPSNAF